MSQSTQPEKSGAAHSVGVSPSATEPLQRAFSQQLVSSCELFCEGAGYPYFLIVASIADRQPRIWAHGPALRWERYRSTSDLESDPILRQALRSPGPCTWSELGLAVPFKSSQVQPISSRDESDGLIVPLYGPLSLRGYFSAFGATCPSPGEALDAQLASACLLVSRLVASFLHHARATDPLIHSAERVTPAQKAVLALLAEGRSLEQVAERLGVHIRTVQGALRRAQDNLGVKTREQAVHRATLLGLLPPGS